MRNGLAFRKQCLIQPLDYNPIFPKSLHDGDDHPERLAYIPHGPKADLLNYDLDSGTQA